MHQKRNAISLLTILCAGIFVFNDTSTLSRGYAQEEVSVSLPLNEQEQDFVKMLTKAKLTGSFTTRNNPDKAPKSESYEIDSVEKVQVSEDVAAYWVVKSRIKYGQTDVVLPIPVKVEWAGQTPVMSLVSSSILGLGDGFDCRVLFYKDEYAGTWAHGKIGGHLFGKITRANNQKDISTKPDKSAEASADSDEVESTKAD